MSDRHCSQTKKDIHRPIKTFFKWCVYEGIVGENVALQVPKIEEQTKQVKIISIENARKPFRVIIKSILKIDLKNNQELLEDFDGISLGDLIKVSACFKVGELSENRANQAQGMFAPMAQVDPTQMAWSRVLG